MSDNARINNSFGEVRLLLALIVFFAHLGALTRADELEWFASTFDADLAIKGFFSISGFLVTRSFFRSSSFIRFYEKRIRRIFPAYFSCIVFCSVVGFFVSELSAGVFFLSEDFFSYFLANIFFLNFIAPDLPGAFGNNISSAVNGSLWTIKVELSLYIMVPFIVVIFSRLGSIFGFLILFLFGVGWFLYFSFMFDQPIGERLARQFPGQLPFFVVGCFLAVTDFPKFWRWALVLTFVIYYFFLDIFLPFGMAAVLSMLLYPVAIIFISMSKILSFGVDRFGDFSFGIYLFHFPVIQLIEHLGVFDAHPYYGLFLCMLSVFSLAFLSWHVVERRFLFPV